jgi:hypothetical protein
MNSRSNCDKLVNSVCSKLFPQWLCCLLISNRVDYTSVTLFNKLVPIAYIMSLNAFPCSCQDTVSSMWTQDTSFVAFQDVTYFRPRSWLLHCAVSVYFFNGTIFVMFSNWLSHSARVTLVSAGNLHNFVRCFHILHIFPAFSDNFAAGAWRRPLTSIQKRGQECLELYLHSPIRLHFVLKVKLSLCLTKHRTMKTYWGSGGIAALILWPQH